MLQTLNDTSILPPLLMTSEKNSFAEYTILVRKPAIIDQIIKANHYPSHIIQALLDFKKEILNHKIQPIKENTSDREIWQGDLGKWTGKTWLELPWFLAETFFYRRVLEITGHFQPGPWMGYDPFRPMKLEEINRSLTKFSHQYLAMEKEYSYEVFKEICQQALWGNRGDLSHIDLEDNNNRKNQEDILIDHTEEAYQYLQTGIKAVAYICDNVGEEFFYDLLLIDWLLSNHLAEKISVYIKNQPFFVSDVTNDDVQLTLNRIGSSNTHQIKELASRLKYKFANGSLVIREPTFFTLAKDFREFPNNLVKEFSEHQLAIIKGDANYRRLIGDRHWPYTTPIQKAAGYFPTSFLSLRTLKSELIIGLSNHQVEHLSQNAESDWLTNGLRGIITFHLKQTD